MIQIWIMVAIERAMGAAGLEATCGVSVEVPQMDESNLLKFGGRFLPRWKEPAVTHGGSAEHRLGIELAKMPKNTGAAGNGRPKIGGSKTAPPKDDVPSRAELGVDKRRIRGRRGS